MLIAPPHVHDWHALDDPPVRRHGCSGCDQVVLACLHCARPIEESSLTVCDRCLDRGRRLVRDIVDDMSRFPYTHMEIIGLRSPRMDVGRVSRSDDDERLPFGMDRIVEDVAALSRWGGIASARTPATALDALVSWAQAWADARREEVPEDWATYLVERTLWAMQTPGVSGWADYVVEAGAVRSTVRRLLGITPVAEGTPCPTCGARVTREWRPRADLTPAAESSSVRRRLGTTAEGLDDVVRCSRCRRSWPDAAHLHVEAIAVLPSLVRRHPSSLMTFGQLAQVYEGRVPRTTIHSWIRREQLLPVCGPWPRGEHRPRRRRDGTTERLYRLADAERLAVWDEALAEHVERATRPPGAQVAQAAVPVASSS